MKRLGFLFIFLFVCITLTAASVSFQDANTIAKNWASSLKTFFKEDVSVIKGESIKRDGVVVCHVFHFSPRGYVIVSAEDYLPPIKAYSLKNNLGKEGKSIEEHIFNHHLQIIKKVKSGEIDSKKYFLEKNVNDFKSLFGAFLPSKKGQSPAAAVQEAAPLLKTTWSQDAPYNLKCPLVDGQQSLTGCAATAFSQVFKYHQYPLKGQGSWSYRLAANNQMISAAFDHVYNWDLMLDSYPGSNAGTQDQRDAVAQLMFDVGVLLSMNYNPKGSYAHDYNGVMTAPVFLDYSREIINVTKMGKHDAEWFDLAKNQVIRGFPLTLGIISDTIAPGQLVGHLVVIDGYRVSDGASTFHINLGWGGSYDGYFSLDNIAIKDNWDFDVLDSQSFVMNIAPPNKRDALPVFDFGVFAHENAGAPVKEYDCEVKWQGLPRGYANIDKYLIAKINPAAATLKETSVAEVKHTGQPGLYQYTFKMSEFTPEVYYVYAVDQKGLQKLLMCCNILLKE